MAGPHELRDGDLAVVVDADAGARLRSLRWRDHELLIDDGRPPFGSHSFVMAPWAGRVRDARATWAGRTLQLPVGDAPHALHGLVLDRSWTVLDATASTVTTRTAVGADEWFAPLTLTQRVEVRDTGIHLDLTVEAPDGPAPATVGWHPWFRRRVAGHDVRVHLPDAAMLRRDDAGIATTARVVVPDGPLDDALVDLAGPVVVRYGDLLEVAVISAAPVTVVFTEHPRAVCVEPQSGPPDEVNGPDPTVVAPDRPLRLSAELRLDTPG